MDIAWRRSHIAAVTTQSPPPGVPDVPPYADALAEELDDLVAIRGRRRARRW